MAQQKMAPKKKAASTSKKKPTSSNDTKGLSPIKKKLLIWGLKIFSAAIMAGGLFVLFVYLGLFGRLPNDEELSKIHQNEASEVYSADGKIMGRYFIEQRISIENTSISPHIKNALVATEDNRFFEHSGIDMISLGRVLVRTVLLGDKAQGGGSTISQQLAKNLYPRQRHGFLSLPVSKVKELFIANKLEDIYSKDQILTLYLNTVPFGEDVYGIEMAAKRFFGKKSRDVNPAESATLIGMLAANTAFNPRKNPEKSKTRRNVVLDRMVSEKFLSKEDGEKWKASDIKLRYQRIDHNTGIAPYFREQIRIKAEKILEDKYGDEYNLFTDGLKITTTIDSHLQKYAADAVSQQMKLLQDEFDKHWKDRDPWEKFPMVYLNALRESNRYQKLKAANKTDAEIMQQMEKKVSMQIFTHSGEKTVTMSPVDSVKHYLKLLNAGFIAINPSNGQIMAWVGGIDHKFSQYDHVTAKRQVGSTFKPIVYTAALDEGMKPCDFISNEKRVYSNYDDWSPGNSGGNHEGYYSLKGGLANSVNTISAEVIIKTGIGDVIDMAEDMGITSKIPKVPSIALGTAELSLFEMASAYCTFPNYGKPIEPVGLLKIEDKDGNILYTHQEKDKSGAIYDEDVAQYIIEMMRGVIDRGTAQSLRTKYGIRSQHAGKTGTTQNNSDGWFIGYTPTIVAGAWVGNDQPSIRFRSTALGCGGHTALPIYALFFQNAEKDGRYSWFTKNAFKPLSNQAMKRLECADYSEKDPDVSLFDRVLDSFDRSETKEERRERREQERKEREAKDDDEKGFLNKMKNLFKKKDK